MIRGIDFYDYVLKEAEKKNNISFLYDDVQKNFTENNTGIVETLNGTYTAQYIFTSVIGDDKKFLFEENSQSKPKGIYTMLQHFKGWMIETEADVFDVNTAGFMDFRVEQNKGTTFVYVLPVSPKNALIEYTLFNEKLLASSDYDDALKKYISQFLHINSYTIIEEEYGLIPMSNYSFKQQEGRVINLGTAGGQTKASSGFTFKFIQKQTKNITQQLAQNRLLHLSSSFNKRKFDLYDAVLLNVLHNNKMGGDEIFAQIFKKNPPQRVLSFLDNETNLWEDLKILSGVPTHIFMPAALHEFIKGFGRK